MLEADKYKRYESLELIDWKKLNEQQQFERVVKISKQYEDQMDIIKIHNQSIEVSLFMAKEDVYHFLVEYESYLREKLGGFPIIVLFKVRAFPKKSIFSW